MERKFIYRFNLISVFFVSFSFFFTNTYYKKKGDAIETRYIDQYIVDTNNNPNRDVLRFHKNIFVSVS